MAPRRRGEQGQVQYKYLVPALIVSLYILVVQLNYYNLGSKYGQRTPLFRTKLHVTTLYTDGLHSKAELASALLQKKDGIFAGDASVQVADAAAGNAPLNLGLAAQASRGERSGQPTESLAAREHLSLEVAGTASQPAQPLDRPKFAGPFGADIYRPNAALVQPAQRAALGGHVLPAHLRGQVGRLRADMQAAAAAARPRLPPVQARVQGAAGAGAHPMQRLGHVIGHAAGASPPPPPLADALQAVLGPHQAAAVSAHPQAGETVIAEGRAAGGTEMTAINQLLRDPPDASAFPDEASRRRAAVKAGMRWAWGGYVRWAWGRDELRPVSRDGVDSFCGLGATIVDSLSTLWMMGLKAEFARARDWVRDELHFDRDCSASLFETMIRIVGGLLSAHDLSGEAIFLTRAEELAQRLLPGFDTPTGFPRGTVHLASGMAANAGWAGDGKSSVLSELGTVQLELLRLTQLTGNVSYGAAAERIIRYARDHYDQGLLPTFINNELGTFSNGQLSMGAMADSYYEYLLKAWVLLGRGPEGNMYRDMWTRAMDEMADKLVGHHAASGLTFVGDSTHGVLTERMEHLTCFVGGNLALGVQLGAATGNRAARYLGLAKDITRTCYQMYHLSPTGLSPEFVAFMGAGREPVQGVRYNILRPEALESIFMLWTVTGNDMYRDWGWEVFQAFEKYSKVDSGGYSGVRDVSQVPPQHDDKMQSFWTAESLKYLFLLFSPPGTLDLARWVLNTEAHPLRTLETGAPLPAFAG